MTVFIQVWWSNRFPTSFSSQARRPSLVRRSVPLRSRGPSLIQSEKVTFVVISLADSLPFVSSFPLALIQDAHQPALSFQKLSGLFEVRPYPKEASIASLLAASAPSPDQLRGSHIIDGKRCSIDVHKLNAALNRIDFAAVKKRKNLYNRLVRALVQGLFTPLLLDRYLTKQHYNLARYQYQEAAIQERISFTSMMLLLSHYKLIKDDDALL